ncbi:MAG TPA: alpha/beta fold hydrolase, partial [Nitriliruptorales bacterium]
MPVQPLPVDVAVADPRHVGVTVSPDGRRWAYLAPVDGVMNLWVGELDGEAKPITALTGRGLSPPGPVTPGYRWTYDSRHLVYFLDGDGDENWIPHAVDCETGETRRLVDLEGVSCRVLKAVPSRPTQLLLSVNGRDPRFHDAHLVDIETGASGFVFENPGFTQVVADDDLAVRAGVEVAPDGTATVVVRDGTSDGWRPVLSTTGATAMTTELLRFSAEGATLYVLTSHGSDRLRPLAIDVRTGAAEALPEDERYDAEGLVVHPTTGALQWIEVFRERRGRILLDARLAPTFARLEQVAAGGDVSVVSRDLADRLWVVAVVRDDGPVGYHLHDRGTGDTRLLCRQRDDLDGYTLGHMDAFRFDARDGVEIEGYLTLPPDTEPVDLPAVLVVHGGPTYRDFWGFNALGQVFATRGYAVIHVNYRGSLGYGQAFVSLGDREWAAAMHTDLLDAVDHLAAAGTIDRDRVAITGGSYGGYAALVGATFTPTDFRCAASIYGPANLLTLIKSFPPYWGPSMAYWHQRIGNPETEPDFMWSRSPLSRAADVQRPLLIVQTANDPRVTRAEAEQMVAALEENGIEHEYLLIE